MTVISIKPHIVFVFALILSGCGAITKTYVPDYGYKVNIKNYERVYVKRLEIDEFNLYKNIVYQLKDMGFEVVENPFHNPTKTDMNVSYSYKGTRDIVRVIDTILVRFNHSQDNKILHVKHYDSKRNGLIGGSTETRVRIVFNEIRSHFGYSSEK